VDLYLVRHAIAEPRDPERWPDDALRPLAPDGIELFRRAARGLRRLGVGVDAVLTSSYLRATQTAELLTEEARWPEAETSPALEPPSPAPAIVDMIGARTEPSLALVGHQPELAELASLLLAASESVVPLELKKGGVIYLRVPVRPAAGSAVLRWSVSPKILRRLGA
jgi:phosphohistidine phosphatase